MALPANQAFLVLTILEKTVGAQHPDTAMVMNNLGLLYEDIGLPKKAESMYKQSLKIVENICSIEHPL